MPSVPTFRASLALAIAAGLSIAAPAAASNDVETTIVFTGYNEVLEVIVAVDDFQPFVDWITYTSALDIPETPGTEHLPNDLEVIHTDGDWVVRISNGFLRLADPAFDAGLDPLWLDYQAGALDAAGLESAASALLFDRLIIAGAPVLSVTADISNGF